MKTAPAFAFKSLNQHQRRLMLVFILTTFYLIVEFIGGIVTQSLALLADAGHMLTDASALGLAFFAARIAEQPATPRHTYGYYRAEILAALANAIVLIGISIYIVYEAIQRFRSPPHVDNQPMLVIATIGLLINIAGAIILSPSTKQSLNIKGAYYEVMLDLVSSVGAIVAALIMGCTGWYYADPLLSLGIGIFILPGTWMLIKESVSILLEGSPSELDTLEIQGDLQRSEGVLETHDLHIWTLTSGINALSVHVVLDGTLSHSETLHKVQKLITTKLNLAHITIQVEEAGSLSCTNCRSFTSSQEALEAANSNDGMMLANPK